MNSDSSEINIRSAELCLNECLSICTTKSPEDTKPFLEKSFGCGICDEMLEIEKEFQDHRLCHGFSPPDNLLINMCSFIILNSGSQG